MDTLLATQDAIHFAQVTRCSHAAAYSLLVWDWLLNFAEERKLIFGSRWTPAKAAYLVSRYYPLFTYPIVLWVQGFDHERDLCGRIFNLPILLVIPNMISAEVILILRTFAFTGGNKRILFSLLACLACVVSFQIWVAATRSALIPVGNGCFPVNRGSSSFLSGFFLSTFLLDCIITTVFAVFALRVMKLRLVATPLTTLLIREGFLYFCLSSAVNLVNASFNLQTANVAMATGAVPLSLLFCNVLTCRLVLNLRRVAHDAAVPGGPHSPDEITAHDHNAYTPAPPPKNAFSFREISGTWSGVTISPLSVPPAVRPDDTRRTQPDMHWDMRVAKKSFGDDLEAPSVDFQRRPNSRANSSISGVTLVNRI